MRRRRLCTCPLHQGPRWLSWVEFHVKVWGDESKTWPAQLQSWCMACQRMWQREHRGVALRGKAYDARQPPMTHEQHLKRRRKLYKKHKKNKQWVEKKRDRQRFAASAKRREAGIAPRQFRRKDPDDVRRPDKGWPDTVNAAMWLAWVEQKAAIVGGIETVFSHSTMTDRSYRRALESGRVRLGTVDAVMTAWGEPDQVYALYGEAFSESKALADGK